MHRRSILRAIPCDLKSLPIGAIEAFVLSQVHGPSVAEDVASAAGLELGHLLRVARRLVEVGALSVDEEPARPRRHTAPTGVRRVSEAPGGKGHARPLLAPEVVPVPRPHRDARSLRIGPREGFVLSQVDGITTTEDLAEITGLSARELSDALHALEAAGAVELGPPGRRSVPAPPVEAPPRARSTTPPARPRPSGRPRAPGTSQRPPAAASRASRPSRAPSAPQASPAAPAPAPEGSQPSGLTDAERALILETAARLEAVDHYGALGVERDADSRTIRRAYHALAARFHPDRFYGKDLGSFRRQLDRIFGRLSVAYETLSRKDRRAPYDASLPPLPAAPTPSRRPPKRPTRKSLPAMRRASTSALAAASTPSPAPPPAPKAAPAPAPRPAPAPAPRPAPSPPSAPTSPLPAAPSSDPLLRLYAGKRRRDLQDHVDVFVSAAREALRRDDVVSAANHYRLAVQCSDDPGLRAALDETDAKARARVREASLEGARAAEKDGRWDEAASKYERAHRSDGEAWIAERAANAMRLAGKNLRGAAQLAEKAVQAEPSNASYRLTLAEIYLDAGMLARAAGETARALAIAPGDPRAAALARRVAGGKR